MRKSLRHALAAVSLAALAPFAFAAEPGYVGVKTCTKCHDVQGESWEGTAHAKAFDSLKANTKVDAKKKAKLDPAKDYAKDKDCVGCHSTGFGKAGGYALGMAPGGQKALGSVGCESCHGASSGFSDKHGAAEKLLKKSGQKTARKTLADSGQNFDYERACAGCHLAARRPRFERYWVQLLDS